MSADKPTNRLRLSQLGVSRPELWWLRKSVCEFFDTARGEVSQLGESLFPTRWLACQCDPSHAFSGFS